MVDVNNISINNLVTPVAQESVSTSIKHLIKHWKLLRKR